MFIELLLPVTLLMVIIVGLRNLLMKNTESKSVTPELVVEGTPRESYRRPVDVSNVIDVRYKSVK